MNSIEMKQLSSVLEQDALNQSSSIVELVASELVLVGGGEPPDPCIPKKPNGSL